MLLTVRPIVTWPGTETKSPQRAPFGATYTSTLQVLDRELRQLGAKHPVLEMWVTDGQVRLDGALRADARPSKPGLILSFESKHGPLRYPCDRFWHWQDNLRAIALGLEALRKVERYGIASRNEQYVGWKALGAGIAIGQSARPTFDSLEAAAEFLVNHGEWGTEMGDPRDLIDGPIAPELVAAYYRSAAKRLHPDVDGGTAELFEQLGEARRMLDERR